MAAQETEAPRPKRRWLTFSLRGTFVLLTVLCIWLAWFAVQATSARKQARAVKEITKMGGRLRFDYEVDTAGQKKKNAKPAAPAWLRKAVGEDYFRTVVTADVAWGGRVTAQHSQVSNRDLAVFKKLSGVTTLELGGHLTITDHGLVHLAELNTLRVLYLYRTGVTGPGLQHLSSLLNLESLSLEHSSVRDEGLAHLRDLAKLRWLQLSNTNVTDDGMPHLSAIRSLEGLFLSNTDVSDAGLGHLHRMNGLKQLDLTGTNVTGRGVANLKKAIPNCTIRPSPEELEAVPIDVALWPREYKPTQAELIERVKQLGGTTDQDLERPQQPIVSLTIMDNNMSDESLLRLLEEMPELETLNLRRVLVGDRLVRELPRFSKLNFLSLDYSRVTDDGLAHVAQIGALRELSLVGTRTTDSGASHLGRMQNLESLHIGQTRLTLDGRARLEEALPKCRVSY
ncbi:MAG: hypothetical protein WD278_02285 [Pirellulales bacterium]